MAKQLFFNYPTVDLLGNLQSSKNSVKAIKSDETPYYVAFFGGYPIYADTLEKLKQFVSSSSLSNEIKNNVANLTSKTWEDINVAFLRPKTSVSPIYFKNDKQEYVFIFDIVYRDWYKKEYDSMETRAIYQGAVGSGIGIDAVDRFIHDIYFTSANENLVRPSEVLSAIKANKISQKDFLNFLTNHTTYQNFKRIQNFNFEQFTQEILSKPKQVDKFLKKLGLDPTTMRDKTKVRRVLEATYNYIANTTISNYSDMLKQSILDELIGFQGEQQVMFTNFIKKVTRFKKPEDFYKYYEKQFKYVADEMIRKISKVYSLVDK